MKSEAVPNNSAPKPNIAPDIAPFPIVYQLNPPPRKTKKVASMSPTIAPMVKPPQTAFFFRQKTTTKTTVMVPRIFQISRFATIIFSRILVMRLGQIKGLCLICFNLVLIVLGRKQKRQES